MKMRATKPMTYMSRRLKVGDTFEAASVRMGKLFEAIGKAEPYVGNSLLTTETPVKVEAPVPVIPKTDVAVPTGTPVPEPVVPPVPVPEPETETPKPAPEDEDKVLNALRAAYHKKTGEEADKRWGEKKLKAELSKKD